MSRKHIKCRYFRDDGSSKDGGCKFPSGRDCPFSHPEDSTWSTAIRPKPRPRDGDFPRPRDDDFTSRKRDSGWSNRNRRDNVNERISSSTWGRSSSPPPPRLDPVWDESAFAPPSTSPRIRSPTYSRQDSHTNSSVPGPSSSSKKATTWTSAWDDGGQETTKPEKTKTDGSGGIWGSGDVEVEKISGWGSAGDSGSAQDNGNTAGPRDSNGWGSANAWRSGDDSTWGSGWGNETTPNTQGTSSNTWGGGSDSKTSDARGNGGANETTSNTQGSSYNAWGGGSGGGSGNDVNPKVPDHASSSKGKTSKSAVIDDSNEANVPVSSNRSFDQPSQSSTDHLGKLQQNPTRNSSLPPVKEKPQETSNDQTNVWYSVGAVPPVQYKGKTTRMPDNSPAHSLTSKDRSTNYKKLVQQTVVLVRLHSELRETKGILERWKMVQGSKQLERVRQKGREKMNKIRAELSRDVRFIENKIKVQETQLLEIPDLSVTSATKVDLIVEGEKVKSYTSEIEAYLADLKAFKEAKLREEEKKELDKEMLADQPPPIEPHIKTWEDLKAHVKAMEGSLHELSDALDEARSFGIKENLQEVEEEIYAEDDGERRQATDPTFRIEEDFHQARQNLEKQEGSVASLIYKMNESKLMELKAKMEKNKETKAELEARLNTYIEQNRQRRADIDAISERIRCLHTRKPPPFSYADRLRPQLEKLVQQTMDELPPILDAMENEHHVAHLKTRQQSIAKINEKMAAMLKISDLIQQNSRVVAKAVDV